MSALSLGFIFYETASADPGDGLLGVADDVVSDATDTAPDAVADTIAPVAPITSTATTSLIPLSEPRPDAGTESPPAQALAEQATEPLGEVSAPVVAGVVETAAPIAQTAAPVVEDIAETAAPIVQTAAPVVQPVIETAAPLTMPITDTLALLDEPVLGGQLSPIVGAVEPVLTAVLDPVQPVLDVAVPLTEPLTGAGLPVSSSPVGVDPGGTRHVGAIAASAASNAVAGTAEYMAKDTPAPLSGVFPASTQLVIGPGHLREAQSLIPPLVRRQDVSGAEASEGASAVAARPGAILSLLGDISPTLNTEGGPGHQVATLVLLGLLGLSLWRACGRLMEGWQWDRLCYASVQPPR